MNKKPLKKGQNRIVKPKKGPQQGKQVKGTRNYDLVGLVVVLLLGIIIYSNSFGCAFNFDDFPNIVYNANIRDLLNVKAWWGSRAIGFFTFALNYYFNHYNVWGYHFVNLLIHLINACLVWWLTLLIFSSPAMKDHKISHHKKLLAFTTALLFVSHPLATQSVTYIVQRLASLVAMFYFLSVALYMKARLTEKGNKEKYILFTGSFLSAIAAMLTKENAFTLPFVVILSELFFLNTKKISVNFKDYRVSLLAAVSVIFILIILHFKSPSNVFNPIGPTHGHTYTLTPFNYLLTQFSVIVKYIQLLILPVNQMLNYDFPVSNSFFELRTFLSFLFLLSLAILGIFLFKKQRVISFGIFWFFITLLVESSIIPIADVIFEHRTYLPSFGFFLILSSTIFIFLWDKYKSLAIILFLIITGSNSWLTYERNEVWKDAFSLWNDNVSKAPDLARPVYNRGLAYADLKQWDNAISDYTTAIRIKPDYKEAYVNRGAAYGNLGQSDLAIDNYGKAIALDPNYKDAYYNRGTEYGKLKQWDKAISDYSRAIEINSNYEEAYINRGAAYGNLGQSDKAINDYTKVIMINPDHKEAYYDRGNEYENQKQWANAISDYSKAIKIDPDYVRAFSNRGIAYANLGLLNKAISDFSRALEIDPNFTVAYNNREIAYRALQSGNQK